MKFSTLRCCPFCGCCGDVFNISEIYKVAPDTLLGDPITVYDDWVGINSVICGEE